MIFSSRIRSRVCLKDLHEKIMKICNFCAKKHKNLKAICENTFLSDNKTIIIEDLLKIFPSDLVELFSFDINCSICRGCLKQLEKCYIFVQQIKEASSLKLKQNVVVIKQERDWESQIKMETCASQGDPNTTCSSQADFSGDTNSDVINDSLSYNFKNILPKIVGSTISIQKVEQVKLPPFESRLYKCLECTQAFKSFKHLREHEAQYCSISALSGIFVCKYCHLCFQEEHSRTEHQLVLHGTQKYVCCICNDKEFPSKGYLARHISKVHEHKFLKYFCGECQELLILANQESVRVHFNEAHSLECNNKDNIVDNKTDPYNEEDMDLEMHEEFLDEFLLAHTHENSFQFSECWEALDLHLPDMLPNHNTNFNDYTEEFSEAFPCPKCFEQFKNPQPLLRHLAEYHNMPVLICRTCRKAFRSVQDFKQHKIDKCSTNPSMEPLAIPCPYCKKTFKSSPSLNQHLRILHTHHKKHICQLCDKQFSTLDHLKKHVLSLHQNERKHICHICSKAFTQLGHLKQHVSIHTTGKTIQCTQCPAMFWRKIDMNRHRKKLHK